MTPLTETARRASRPDHDGDEAVASGRAGGPRRSRRWWVGLFLVFAVTRLVSGYVADHPGVYGGNRPDGTGDVHLYDSDSWYLRHSGEPPYGEVLQLEYPPGALPLMMGPRYLRWASYRTEFIIQMIAIDAIGLLGLVRLARRSGSWWGVGAWLALVPALGPVSYTRLDLAVAVALVWAVERASAGRWRSAGACFGAGAAIKLVPVLLLPMVFLAAARGERRRLVTGAALVVGASLLPFVNVLPDVYHRVLGYHLERGVQAESTWGAALLVAHQVADYPARVVAAFGAYDIRADAAPTLKTISNACAAAVLLLSAAVGWRTRRGDVRSLSLALFGVMALMIGVGRVYSPQYLLWLIALAAVALTLAPRAARPAAGVLAVVVVLAHIEFPFWFWEVLFYDSAAALWVLAVRDVLTLVVGVMALGAWWWDRAKDRADDDLDDPADLLA